MNKPIIGVTPLWDEEKNSYWMLPGYLEGLEEAGAIPVILPLAADGADIAQLVDLCDGFLFTGGQDVAPQLYGEAMKPTCGELCPARDALEQELLRQALERDKPILGICRGIQFLNAALGGTLYQDLPTEHPSEIGHSMKPPYDRTAHTVHIWPMTPLASLLEKTELGVNSCHHQAIKTLAPEPRGDGPQCRTISSRRCICPARPSSGRSSGTRRCPYTLMKSSREIFEVFVRATNQK